MNTYEDCWEACLKSMQQELGDFAFKTWFGDLQFISYENNTIILKSSDNILYRAYKT